MQVSVERVSNIERRLTISVPANQLEEAYAIQLQELKAKANIKGFRPGKVPMSYLVQHYGASARQEAINEVVRKTLSEAIDKEELKMVGLLKTEPKFNSGSEVFEYVAVIEVLPEIENITFKLESLEQLVVDVTDEDVDRVIKQLSKQYTKEEKVEIDEDFVRQLGIASGNRDELREQIKQSLLQERDRLVKEKKKEQVFQQFLSLNPLEVPQALVHREAQHIHDEIYPPHHTHDHHQHTEAEHATFNEIAKKRVTLGLLIAEYAKQQGLKPDQKRVDERIQEIAKAYQSPQQVIDYLSAKDQRSGFEAQVLEEQVMDKLIENVPVVEKKISYAELKGIRI